MIDTIKAALAVAEDAKKIQIADNASDAVRSRFAALQDLAAEVRRLHDEERIAAIVKRSEEAEAENAKMSRQWNEMDSEARRLRIDLFEIESYARDCEKAADEVPERKAWAALADQAAASRLAGAKPSAAGRGA